jgi:hypothetical protein
VTNLRKEAAGRTCMIRMPNICNHREDDCVLCHAQSPTGIRGMGQKSPDLIAAWGCSQCHDEYDRRTRRIDVDQARFYFYEGVLRTQAQLILEGKVKW